MFYICQCKIKKQNQNSCKGQGMKKYLHLFLIFYFAICLLPLQSYAQQSNTLKVISFNIRYDNPDDGNNSWSNRKKDVVSLLRFHDADIFCLQEALTNQIHDIEKAFPGYDYYGPCRDDGKQKGEACPVFFRKIFFTLKDQGTFWYSDTPDVPGSIDWEANLPRIASWVMLKEISTGQQIFVVSTHFDHQSQLSRNNSAKLLNEKIDELSDNSQIIVCGDFNDRPNSETYLEIINRNNEIELTDARTVSEEGHHGPEFTFIGFDFEGNDGDVIDYIFVNDAFKVKKHAYLTDNRNGVFPSDHLPVFVELSVD